jgi:lantibiotic modifying enzyme
VSALPNRAPAADPRERFLDVAWSIGTLLCRDAIWDGDRCNWLGDSMEAHAGEWKVAHKSFGPDLYSGTSGIALFLAQLHRFRPDGVIAQTARGALRQALSRADEIPAEMRHALYSGWIGIALALLDAARFLDDPSLQREALRLVDVQLGHEIDPMSLDVIGGAAGAILGLCAIDRRLGDDRHLAEARRLGGHLLKHAHRGDGGWSWTTMPPLAEAQKDLTGYSHGTAGIALALLELFVRTRDARFLEGALGGFAYERRHFSAEQQNWPDFRSFSSPNPQQPGYSLAWCHGAPGIVCRFATAPRTPEWDQLLLQAGNLIWRAGPLSKGAGLCHGTAGSGFAMLKLWRRSGEPVWLDRARALAMHGHGQVERHRASYGQGRFSLWTGDLGLACLLWNCIAGSDALPTLDEF